MQQPTTNHTNKKKTTAATTPSKPLNLHIRIKYADLQNIQTVKKALGYKYKAEAVRHSIMEMASKIRTSRKTKPLVSEQS